MLTLEYKLDGTHAQYTAMDEAIRTMQFVRNKCLRKWMDADKDHPIKANDLQTFCAALAAEFPFAATLGSQARQVAAGRAGSAIERFYANCQAKKPGKKGYPKFQHDCRSVEYKETAGWKLEDDGRHITFSDGNGIGRVRLIGKKEAGIATFPVEQIKRVRILRRTDGYFCQFCIDIVWQVEHQATGTQVGIDMGLKEFYTDSDGNVVHNPRFLRKAEKKLKYLQRQVSRKSISHKKNKKPKAPAKQNIYPVGHLAVKHEPSVMKQWHTQATKPKTICRNTRKAQHGARNPIVQKPMQHAPNQKQSNNSQKARNHLANLHRTIQRQREDFARKTASALVSSHDLIAYEDLQIRNMVKNHTLAKSISDASWGRFLSWLSYYAAQHGIPCIAVPPQFTSQNCSGVLPDGTRCPQRVTKSLSVRTHVCPRCGLVIDRDHNSGKLVLERALLSVPSGRRERTHPA